MNQASSLPQTFDDIRDAIPALHDLVYFQTSGHSLKPEPIIEEVMYWLRFQNRGPAVASVHEQIETVIEMARSRVADTLGSDPDEIVLGENATMGINIVANGIQWQKGDNIVLTTHEHPGNRIPWYNIAALHGVELRFVSPPDSDDAFVEAMRGSIDARTRLVTVSHVSRQTGRRFPVAKITTAAHQLGVPVLVDGAQSFGAVPIDVAAIGCDFYTVSGHKYIMAPQGTGALYVRKDRIEWLKPSWIGSRSQCAMDSNGMLVLRDYARRFEYGTRNVADFGGLAKALEMWKNIGWNSIFDWIATYTDNLKMALGQVMQLELVTPKHYERSSGIVTFNLEGVDSHDIVHSLWENEMIVASWVDAVEFRQPGVRISTHVFNTDKEIELLVNGIERTRLKSN